MKMKHGLGLGVGALTWLILPFEKTVPNARVCPHEYRRNRRSLNYSDIRLRALQDEGPVFESGPLT